MIEHQPLAGVRGGGAELVDGDSGGPRRWRQRRTSPMETTAARGGPDDSGAGREGSRRRRGARTAPRDRTAGRRRREAGRAAARPPTLALGGRDAGEEGGYDGLKAPSGGRFCFLRSRAESRSAAPSQPNGWAYHSIKNQPSQGF